MPSDAGSHAPSHAPSSQPYTPSYNPSTYNPRESRDPYGRRESRDTSTHRERIERLTAVTRPQPQPQPQAQPQPQHTRNDSIVESAADYPEPQHVTNGRRHDYDVQAMESDLSPRSAPTKNPIPAPTVSIRSEFPTLNRSRQQQSLACLITVEIPEGNWSPDAEDLRQSSGGSSVPQDEPYGIMRFPTVRTSRSSQFEPQENLDEVAEDLRTRVDNWHGLEFNRYERISCSITNWIMLTIVNFFCRFGKLRLHGHMRVGKDRESWQELECYLFAEMLICIKEKRPSNRHDQYDDQVSKPKPTRCTLKGSILIKKHLRSIEGLSGKKHQ